MTKFLLPFLFLIASYSFGQKMNGISVNGEKYAPDFSNFSYLKKTNANWVSVQSFGFIKSTTSGLEFNREGFWYSQTIEGVTDYIKAAKQNNFKVLLKPHTIVEHQGSWSGNFNYTTEKDWKKLEETYTEYILTFAEMAEENEVDAMSIGVEIGNFAKKRKTYFSDLIKSVRKVYSGKLTYCANWDYYQGIPFWKELDFIGIDSYFSLSNKETPSVEQCIKNMKPIKLALKRTSQYFGKKIVFTEFGFQSRNQAGFEPWNWKGNKKAVVNTEAQAICYQAIFDSFWYEDWFLGGFSWKWYIDYSKSGGAYDNSYTPQNKPAEKVISSFYNKNS